MSTTETEKQIYRGNCHCGAFKFSVELAPITKASRCNCSICSRKGYLFIQPEKLSDFKVEAGEDVLRTYTFGGGIAEHKFCPTCGTAMLVSGPTLGFLAININTFKHGLVDTETLEISTANRAHIDPKYIPFELPEEQKPDMPEGMRLYTGSCHCQAVKHTVVCPEIKEVTTCNCSFCSRNADMWIYPPLSSVSLLDTEANLKTYTFGSGTARHSFCSVCGVDVVNMLKLHVVLRPINVRTMDGINLEDLEIKKVDRWSVDQPPFKAYDV